MHMMNWLPNPLEFRKRLKVALLIDDLNERLENLTQLAQSQLSFMETIQLDNALQGMVGDTEFSIPRIRLAVLASCTIDHLLPAIRVAGLRHRMHISTYAGPFGQYRQELLDPTSGLHKFDPEIVLFSLTAREAIAGVPVSASNDDAEHAVSNSLDELSGLWQVARQKFDAAIIQQSFLDISEPLFGSFDQLVPGTPARLIACLNERLSSATSEEGVMLLDVARASARSGIDAWFDVTRWLQGKIEIAPQAAPLYGDLVARLIGAQRGLSKKCLVLDLDNTLWAGVIGDDGLDGIVLGEGSAVGEAHLALQRYALSLRERGIILAVCSKNEQETAEAVFTDHPEMAIKRADIAAFVANWNDKAENLKIIAEQLNIGLDSLVFADDNPVERARIRESLPMVAVPELPTDPSHYVRCIADAGYFESVGFTVEDQQRAGQYAANASREALHIESQSMDDFLRGLDMYVTFGPVTSVDLPRATQLVNKTNQFNTTTRRYTAEEMSRLAADPDDIMLHFRLADRFGDNGMVSIVIMCRDPVDADVLNINSWVMSCRVFGRQLENEVMNIAVQRAKDQGFKRLRADYIPTKKNGVIKDLYEKLDFSCAEKSHSESGASRWTLDLDDYSIRTTFITHKAQ